MNFKEEKIVYKHINELIPYENNPRINKDAAQLFSRLSRVGDRCLAYERLYTNK